MKYFLILVAASAVAFTSMTCHAPTAPTNAADTTSNDWAFTETLLGGASGSNLYDVDIVNDTIAYAVGDIYIYIRFVWSDKPYLLWHRNMERGRVASSPRLR